jgi:hypothetical protein
LAPLHADVEQNAVAGPLVWRWLSQREGPNATGGLAGAGQVLAPGPEEIEKSITLLRRMLEVYAERPRDKE